MLSAPRTHLYVDTSFLMWMTKIGEASRRELLQWMEPACAGRLHVPAWSAHEYLRHHTRRTLVEELKKKTDELATIAGGTFSYIRPFLDDPMGGSTSADAQQATAREALTSLKSLAATASRWKGRYEAHAAEVIGFINRHVVSQSGIFDYFETIEALGEGRYTGRIPPGFQDRNKKEESLADGEGRQSQTIGSNSWGDLLFWRETLDHAKRSKAKAIILLTNDRKNDWHMAGGAAPSADEVSKTLRSAWRPVPRAHPMLVFEAHAVAKVEDVVLLDSQYLGNVLNRLLGPRVKGFVDVAVVPDPPEPLSEREQKKQAGRRAISDVDAGVAARLEVNGARFPDRPGLNASKSHLRRAILESRGDTAPPQTVIDFEAAIATSIEGRLGIQHLFDAEHLRPFEVTALVQLFRRLHDHAIDQTAGYVDVVTDLATLFSEFPRHTAQCGYLGMLASMYLRPADNEVRLPPRSPVAAQLFAHQTSAFSGPPIEALAYSVARAQTGPLYLPNPALPSVPAVFDLDYEVDEGAHLRSLRMNGEELLTPAQPDRALRLVTLLGEESATAGRLLRFATEIFAVPFEQVVLNGDLDAQFEISPQMGFKAPGLVGIDKGGDD